MATGEFLHDQQGINQLFLHIDYGNPHFFADLVNYCFQEKVTITLLMGDNV